VKNLKRAYKAWAEKAEFPDMVFAAGLTLFMTLSGLLMTAALVLLVVGCLK